MSEDSTEIKTSLFRERCARLNFIARQVEGTGSDTVLGEEGWEDLRILRFENSKKKLRGKKKNQDPGEINRDQIQEEICSLTPLKEKELFGGGYASMSSDIHSCDISE